MERTVPYVDIAGSGVPLHDELKGAFARVLHRGQFVLSAEVDEFEARFAELCGTKFAVGVNSGTDAMILALRALDIGSGDEVITAPNSFMPRLQPSSTSVHGRFSSTLGQTLILIPTSSKRP